MRHAMITLNLFTIKTKEVLMDLSRRLWKQTIFNFIDLEFMRDLHTYHTIVKQKDHGQRVPLYLPDLSPPPVPF